jgi:hypothetical protein
MDGGVGDSVEMMGVVEGTLYWFPGGGAPLTSWSRFDIALEVQSPSYCIIMVDARFRTATIPS